MSDMEQPPDPFDRLPDEVFQLIFGAIQDCQTLVRCMAVSKAFRAQSVRVPSLSIVCPGTFSSYDAKLRGVYMMVKEFIRLESLVVRVGQPKEEPPSWARCMRYAEIGASVEKFVFMAAKSGDFAEFDVELAEAEVGSEGETSVPFDRQRENTWRLWGEDLLSSERASPSRSDDESDENMSRRDHVLRDVSSPQCLQLGMDVSSQPCSSVAAGAADVIHRGRAEIGEPTLRTRKSLEGDCQTNVASEQGTTSSGTEQAADSSSPGQATPSECHDMKRDVKLKRLQEDASSSSNEKEGPGLQASSSETGECSGSYSTLEGDPAPVGTSLDDRQSSIANSPTDRSPDAVTRDSQNLNVRYSQRRRLSGYGKYPYEGWDFVRERSRVPDFPLRQVIAPSNDVLKRMVPVIVFAIVQGLDEFRDSVPIFISKFVRLKRLVLVDMVESVTVYMREHQIQEVREHGVSQREEPKECQSSGTQPDSDKASNSKLSKKTDDEIQDIRDVENLPDFSPGVEATADREKGRRGRRRNSGKIFKEARSRGFDLGHRTASDCGREKEPMSEDDCKDQDIRRWMGKGVISDDDFVSYASLRDEDVYRGSGDSTAGNQDADTPSCLPESGMSECSNSSQDKGKNILSRPCTERPAADYGGDVSDISVCVNCGLADTNEDCQLVDCPRLTHSTGRNSGEQHLVPDSEVICNDSILACAGEADAAAPPEPEGYLSLKDLASPDRVSHAAGSSEGGNHGNQHVRLPAANCVGVPGVEESCQASSSSQVVETDASSKRGPVDGIIAGETSTESGSESENKGRSWFHYFVGLKPDRETCADSQVGGIDAPSLGPSEGGQPDLLRQAPKTGGKSESQRSRKEGRNSRRSREEARGFSVRRSHRIMLERTSSRLRLPSLPGQLMVEAASWGGASVAQPDPEILSSGAERSGGEMEGIGKTVAESEDPERERDAALVRNWKGKQVMEEGVEDSEESRSDFPGAGSSSSHPRWDSSGGYCPEKPSLGLQPPQPFTFHEQVQTEEHPRPEDLPRDAPSPAPGLGESLLSRGHPSGLGWIQLREATRGDRPRFGYPPFDRLPRDRASDRDAWRQRVGRRSRESRRDGEVDRERRERMREGVRKRQRDIETEALYFDISFWRAEQVVAQNYTLSDVSMCVATHCAKPLAKEELDVLSKAALAGPLLTATMGYVNKQVGSHNL